MNVLHLATFDTHGGAAVAALRLIEGLQRKGHDARLLVREKATEHPSVDAWPDADRPTTPPTDGPLAQLTWLFTQRARTTRSDAPFSSDLPTWSVADHPAVRGCDVLHLHWVAGWLSAFEIRRLQDLGKPIVWTLHDQFPFTGGCHYSGTCRGFSRACARCPQLVPDAQRLATLTLAQKRDFIDPARIRLAAPSRWLAKCARESALFGRARIDVVPYGLDVAARRTITPQAARQALDIPADAIVVFASSVNNRETRKGDAHLVEALRLLRARQSRRRGALERRLLVLTAGEGARDSEIAGFPCRTLGALAADDQRLVMAYRAADVFVLPSLEDNLPNTLLEAMAAGVPVVGYRTGGILDFLQDGVNGRLVRRGDIAALADALGAVLGNDTERRRLGDAAAKTASEAFDLPVQTAAYERIYADEIGRLARPASRLRSAQAPRLRSGQAPRLGSGQAPRLRSGQARGRSGKRPAATAAPLADAPRLKALLDDRTALRLFADLLRQELEEHRGVIASRGGEIQGLHAAAAWQEAEHRRYVAEVEGVIAARGGEIRDLRSAAADAERRSLEMQQEVASRGGEIRELKRALETARAQRASDRRESVRRIILSMKAAGDSGRLVAGVFGVGEGGLQAIDALLRLDGAVAWVSDNNAAARTGADLGCDAIAPEDILQAPVDVIVIGSAHRDAIRAQLVALGVAPDRIVAPDVSRSDADVLSELQTLIAPRRRRG